MAEVPQVSSRQQTTSGQGRMGASPGIVHTHTYTTNYTPETASRIFQLLVGRFSVLLSVFASIVLETLFVPV
jgi:hypothetical protein